MTPGARVAAAAEILDQIGAGMAAEVALSRWARSSRFAGSKDRAAIRDHVFDVLRAWRSVAALGGGETGRHLMHGLLRQQGADLDSLFSGQGHALAPLSEAEKAAGFQPQGAAALDIPDWLLPLWRSSLGDKADEVAQVLQTRAPVMLRVNTRKATRDEVRDQLADDGIVYQVSDISPTAIVVVEGARRVAQSAAYTNGLVELQDGASQALVDALPLPKTGTVLDYCAGGGGKSLAMAAQTDAKIYAHDISAARMKDLPIRAERAGVQVARLTTDQLRPTGPFDLVLTDAPCSGSGSWRRSPEGKWALTKERLDDLTRIQAEILEAAAGLVAPGGILAYATCSVLAPENDQQLAAFLGKRTEWQEIKRHHWLPGPSGDGFFLTILRGL